MCLTSYPGAAKGSKKVKMKDKDKSLTHPLSSVLLARTQAHPAQKENRKCSVPVSRKMRTKERQPIMPCLQWSLSRSVLQESCVHNPGWPDPSAQV